MTHTESIRIGLESLRTHKLRTLLTMLGIIFGVAAVVAMQSIGAGAKRELLDAIRGMGVNNIIVEAKDLKDQELRDARSRNPKGLSESDARAVREVLTDVREVVPVRYEEAKVTLPSETKINLVGTTPDYLRLLPTNLQAGRFLSNSDDSLKMPVIVLTHTLKRELYPLEKAVGTRIRIDTEWYTVIGVVQPPEGSAANGKGAGIRDRSRDAYIPMQTMNARRRPTGDQSPLQQIIIQVSDESFVRPIAAATAKMMDRRHRSAGDVDVVVPVELLKQSQKTQRIFNIVMGAIASISLLVGGIGIMNIMLSNVLERTREIGVRRAVGAKKTDVVEQFLMEAVLLCLLGGIIGIVLGSVMAWGITLYAGWKTVVGLWAVIVAFGVSTGVGILFGWWPAKKAAEMDVINSLRYE